MPSAIGALLRRSKASPPKRTESRCGCPFHQFAHLRKTGENIVGACANRLIADRFAGGSDEPRIELDRVKHAVGQRLCVLVQRFSHRSPTISRVKR